MAIQCQEGPMDQIAFVAAPAMMTGALDMTRPLNNGRSATTSSVRFNKRRYQFTIEEIKGRTLCFGVALVQYLFLFSTDPAAHKGKM